MRWHRQMDSGEVRTALKGPQQLAGGPARLPVERKGSQLRRRYKVESQVVGVPVADGVGGGGGGGLVAAGCSTAIKATAMARKETAGGAAIATSYLN
jgi:hypothetical protein